jgi:DNA-binding MarR family transcriptional regulator
MNGTRQELIAAIGDAVQAYQRSTDALDDVVSIRLGVNRTDLRCLDWLSDGPIPVGKLADSIGLSSAAMTTLLDRLADKGYLRRRPDVSDRRRVLVEMTELCRRLTGRIYGPLVQTGASIFADFQPAQLKTIRLFLDKAREVTDEHRQRLRDNDRPI